MKTITNRLYAKFPRNKIVFSGVAMLNIVLMLSLNSCAQQQRVSFTTSTVVPAAEGRVTLKSDKNKNYVVELKVSNLADVSRLDPPRNVYVAWMETERGQVRNLGRVITSRNLNASLETVTTDKPRRIFITAENDENIQFPGNMLVLTTDDF
ncbi:MAG: hypothetical protein ACFCUM_08510 [Bacteroidales bacterium]